MSRKSLSETNNIDVDGMSEEDLLEIQQVIEAELKKRAAKRRRESKRQILELARKNRIDLSALARKTSDYTEYRDPENPFNTWSGRGRKPKWVKDALEQKGLTLEDLRVNGPV